VKARKDEGERWWLGATKSFLDNFIQQGRVLNFRGSHLWWGREGGTSGVHSDVFRGVFSRGKRQSLEEKGHTGRPEAANESDLPREC